MYQHIAQVTSSALTLHCPYLQSVGLIRQTFSSSCLTSTMLKLYVLLVQSQLVYYTEIAT